MKDHELATLANSGGRELKRMPDGIWRMFRKDGSVVTRGKDWRDVAARGIEAEFKDAAARYSISEDYLRHTAANREDAQP